jgi:hypothetical protein
MAQMRFGDCRMRPWLAVPLLFSLGAIAGEAAAASEQQFNALVKRGRGRSRSRRPAASRCRGRIPRCEIYLVGGKP